jgi:hypothetical protein
VRVSKGGMVEEEEEEDQKRQWNVVEVEFSICNAGLILFDWLMFVSATTQIITCACNIVVDVI